MNVMKKLLLSSFLLGLVVSCGVAVAMEGRVLFTVKRISSETELSELPRNQEQKENHKKLAKAMVSLDHYHKSLHYCVTTLDTIKNSQSNSLIAAKVLTGIGCIAGLGLLGKWGGCFPESLARIMPYMKTVCIGGFITAVGAALRSLFMKKKYTYMETMITTDELVPETWWCKKPKYDQFKLDVDVTDFKNNGICIDADLQENDIKLLNGICVIHDGVLMPTLENHKKLNILEQKTSKSSQGRIIKILGGKRYKNGGELKIFDSVHDFQDYYNKIVDEGKELLKKDEK